MRLAKKNDKMTTEGKEGPFKVIVQIKDTLNSEENVYYRKAFNIRKRKHD